MQLFENNQVSLRGIIAEPPVFDHQLFGEVFYSVKLEVPRLSTSSDILPVTLSSRLIVDMELTPGLPLAVEGQLRSYNKHINGNNRLVLTVFARDAQQKDLPDSNPNLVFLRGTLCKPPIYRMTPFKREISDLLLAVNRAYGKSDYIPCIAWGRNARYCEKLGVGDQLEISGRMQSRQYQKRLEDGTILAKTAYEVSVGQLATLMGQDDPTGLIQPLMHELNPEDMPREEQNHEDQAFDE